MDRQYEDLKVLGKLLEDGIITIEEYNAKVKKIISVPNLDLSDKKDLDDNSETLVNNVVEKKDSSLIRFFLIGCLIVCVIAAIYNDITSNNNDVGKLWSFNPGASKEMRYDEVSVQIPADWEISDYTDGKEATNSYSTWFRIQGFGEFDSWRDFTNELDAEGIRNTGKRIEIEGCRKAIEVSKYKTDNEEYIYACILMKDNKCYWVGGGTRAAEIYTDDFKLMLNSIRVGS